MARKPLRLSVWSYREDPAHDQPFRKSEDYCRTEVNAGRAQWVTDAAGMRIGIQTLSPDEISRRSREPQIPSLGGKAAMTAEESKLNAESRSPVEIPHDERNAKLKVLAVKIEQKIEQAVSEGRHDIPYRVRVMVAESKQVAYPIVNESCRGAKATMVAVGLCHA